MKTHREIAKKYKPLHDDLTEKFYKRKRAGKVTPSEQRAFDVAHKQIWDDLEVELIAEGVKPPQEVM